jgi:hypothetical protein
LTSICLAFENPLNDPEGTTKTVLNLIDYVTTVFFVIEVLLKGFAIGPVAYIKDPWNLMDFVIVITSLIAFIPNKINMNSFKVLRMARLLRPLRIISRNENLKISI